jgi:transcriptional regulator with XRE-family HTH domain
VSEEIEELERKLKELDPAQRTLLTEGLFADAKADFKSAEPDTGAIKLAEVDDVSVELHAYLASALTGLSEDERRHIFLLSDTISLICSDYGIKLYEPRKATDPVHHPDVKDHDVFKLDRTRVQTSDLLICLAHHPSFGAGQELDFAFSMLLPILVITPMEKPVSRMVKGIPTALTVIQYREPEELKDRLRAALIELKPLLLDRRFSLAKPEAHYIGLRVRALREQQGWTQKELAQAARVEVAFIEQLESENEKESNPSIMQLRVIATVLKVPLARLIDPAPNERTAFEIMDALPQLLAARYGHMRETDKAVVIRSILERAMGLEGKEGK